MRVGMVGLAALYWPMAIGSGLQARKGVKFLAAATLGASEVAIRDTLGVSAAEYAEKFKVKLYNQPEEMMASERLDTLVLITRHSEHAAWVERVAPLGANIFIPKTFTTTLSDAERIVAAQKRHGIQIAVGPSARYLPDMMAAKNAVDKGLIGKPFAVRICHHHGTIDGFHKNDWYRDPQEGGPELSLGWYGIDLVLHFMEDRVQTVFAEYGNFTTPDSPFMDCGRIVMRMERGGIASFDMYFCNRVPYPSWQVEIVGPQGVISIYRSAGDSTKAIVGLDSARGYQVLPRVSTPVSVPNQTPGASEYTREWEMFWVDDLQHGRAPAISAEAAKVITEISLAARDSAHQRCPIAL
jgi:myo-inositol 2-dehydrogenase/D-chiro-inositol 1-dehydrogenase